MTLGKYFWRKGSWSGCGGRRRVWREDGRCDGDARSLSGSLRSVCVLHPALFTVCICAVPLTDSAVRAVVMRDKLASLRCALRASDLDFTSQLPMRNHLVQALLPSPSRGAKCQFDVVKISDALDRGHEISAAAVTRWCSGVDSASTLWCFRHMHMRVGKRTTDVVRRGVLVCCTTGQLTVDVNSN
jgi:hypothetical protein